MKPLLIVGGLAVAGGVGYVLYQRMMESAGDGAYSASLRCKAARMVAMLYGRTISDSQCELADKVDDTIGLNAIVNWLKPGQSWGDKDKENQALNGPVLLALSEEIRGLTTQVTGNVQAPTSSALLNGSVLRFKNGGVPFAKHPDFAKCVPGTHDMTAPGDALRRFWNVTPGVRPSSSQLRAGLVKLIVAPMPAVGNVPQLPPSQPDVPESRWPGWVPLGLDGWFPPRLGEMFTGANGDPTTSIKLGLVAGVKFACPQGQVLIEVLPVRDAREGASALTDGGSAIIKRCGAPGTAPTAPPPLSNTSTTRPDAGAQEFGAPRPGYRWVLATATVPAHYERIQAP